MRNDTAGQLTLYGHHVYGWAGGAFAEYTHCITLQPQELKLLRSNRNSWAAGSGVCVTNDPKSNKWETYNAYEVVNASRILNDLSKKK